jgi:hypothetical protein
MYTWEPAVQLAICETQTTKLHEAILDAEALIFTRGIELASDTRRHYAVVERAAMELATKKLMHLRTTMLHWPSPDFV